MKYLTLFILLIPFSVNADGLYIDFGMTNSGSLFDADLDYESEEELGTIFNVKYVWHKPFKKTKLPGILRSADAVCGYFHDSQLFYGFPYDNRSNEFDRNKAGCYLSWKVWD